MNQDQTRDGNADKTVGFKAKLGLYMIAFYTIVYFAFIIIGVTNPRLMAANIGSLNLAITYGFGLIILAILQALVYNYICAKREKAEKGSDKAGGVSE